MKAKVYVKETSPVCRKDKTGQSDKSFEIVDSNEEHEGNNKSMEHSEPRVMSSMFSEDECALRLSLPCGLKRTCSFLTTPVQFQSEVNLPHLAGCNVAPSRNMAMRKKQSLMDPRRLPVLPDFPILEEAELSAVIQPRLDTTRSFSLSTTDGDFFSRRKVLQTIGQNMMGEFTVDENCLPSNTTMYNTSSRSPMKVLNRSFSTYPELPRCCNLKMRTSLVQSSKAANVHTHNYVTRISQSRCLGTPVTGLLSRSIHASVRLIRLQRTTSPTTR